ncbi:MAG TPA: hypothetical protein VGF95_00435 [Solirubrobacteraceae bacterium]|jgi:hypothetical protein
MKRPSHDLPATRFGRAVSARINTTFRNEAVPAVARVNPHESLEGEGMGSMTASSAALRRSAAAVLAAVCMLFAAALACAQPALAAAPPSIEDESVSNVASTSATLNATIDPQEGATTYRFEYGPTATYGTSAPLSERLIAAGTSGVAVEVHVQGLTPSTNYHYRVVATNAEGTEPGADSTFTTEGLGGPLTLLDGRQWELVTPPNKHGALIESGRPEGGVIQAATDGDAIAYYASAPVTGEEAGSRSPEQTSVLSRRGADGWSTEDLMVQHDEGIGLALYKGTEYKTFSTDLSRGLLEPYDFLKLTPETTEWTPYLRDNLTAALRPLLTATDVLPGAKFDPEEADNLDEAYRNVKEFEAGNPELTHVVLRSEVPLTANATGYGLYEWFEGALQLISILPGATETPATGGHGSLYVGDGPLGDTGRDIHAVSEDGSRVVFAGDDPTTKEAHLYLRDVALQQTAQIDVGGTSERARFWAANADDSKVFFSDEEALTPGATSGNLYQCEVKVVSEVLNCDLSDLSTGVSVEGVIGASEDGSYVYFVATGSNGTIYLAHEGMTEPVATIGALGGIGASYFNDPNDITLRVAPDGQYLAFMSTLSLTGYDNRDAVSGEPDTEVYLYSASTREIMCASCNPTGARPQGLEIHNDFGSPTQSINDRASYLEGTWLSGSIPAWINNSGIAFNQPAYLSNGGRLFFNSAEALVPQDVNGFEDVYEYEPDGAGSCETGEGCVELVSSGSSQEESIFMDASATGDDAFFLTAQPLVAKDVDKAADIYDAHVCSEEAPCVSEPVSPPPCESSDACKGAPATQPTVFGPPPSATFSGAVNPIPLKAKLKSTKKAGGKRTRPRHKASRRCAAMHEQSRHKRSRCKHKAKKSQAGAHGAAGRHGNSKARAGEGGGR